jgi:hypothetical protein
LQPSGDSVGLKSNFIYVWCVFLRVYDEHNNDFHMFNRKLTQECSLHGTGHTITSQRGVAISREGDPDSSSLGVVGGFEGAGAYVLGGSRPPSDVAMRDVLAGAVMQRLTAEEEELTKGCGGKG